MRRSANYPVTWSGAGWENLLFRSIGNFADNLTKLSTPKDDTDRDAFMSDQDALSTPSDESDVTQATRDIADVAAVEVITTAAVHLMSAAAVKVGLADDPENQIDLDEARKLINALAGLITAGAPDISDMHARSLRDGLRSVQLAFREASPIPDAIGQGPGEKYTGPVN